MGILKHGSSSCGIITNSFKDKLFPYYRTFGESSLKKPPPSRWRPYMSLILYYLAISTVYNVENHPKPVTPTCIFKVILFVHAEKVPVCPAYGLTEISSPA